MVSVPPFLFEALDNDWGDRLLDFIPGQYLEVLVSGVGGRDSIEGNGVGDGDRDLVCECDGCLIPSNILKVLKLDGDFFTL